MNDLKMLNKNFFLAKKKIFPLNRSITGNGTLKTLKIIKKRIPKLKIVKIKSKTNVFDWKVPPEWNINNAYILDKNKNLWDLGTKGSGQTKYSRGEIWDTDGAELASYRNIEFFFTSINMPELHAKQCHLVKNYLTKNSLPANDTKLIKHIIRTVIRDTPVAPEPDFLKKSFIPSETLFLGPKCRAQYKSASNEQKDKIKHLFKNATINGYIMPNLMTNYRAKKLYLGENGEN